MPNGQVRPTSNPMLRATLVWTGYASIALIAIAVLLGWLFAGPTGVWSALAGSVLAVVMLALTPLSMLVANRWYQNDNYSQIFFATVMGGWLLKFVLFFVAIFVLRAQEWLVPLATFLALIAGIAVSLAIDTVVFMRVRVPYVPHDRLPLINPEDDPGLTSPESLVSESKQGETNSDS